MYNFQMHQDRNQFGLFIRKITMETFRESGIHLPKVNLEMPYLWKSGLCWTLQEWETMNGTIFWTWVHSYFVEKIWVFWLFENLFYFFLQFQALYNDAKEYGMNIDYPIQGPGSCTKIPCGIDKLETELKSFKKNNPNLQVVMRFHELF